MGFFFILPEEIIFEVFSEWGTVRELAKLDSAECSNKYRNYFLDLIGSERAIMSGSGQSQNFALWAILRHLCLKSVDFDQVTTKLFFETQGFLPNSCQFMSNLMVKFSANLPQAVIL